ncbi:metallophosphoesterase [Gluconacetobacter diazotrophicus PA1 5]|uniref:Putative phosphoesterases n=1 Tax=Gluconacetobacter diazotrophicus (strain ATCC 49037 / DSM 5601 / CCUG 37298 / CIP 103539 / LMG 7603 / PAl5) TaxID=272568 RepID=A9HIJ4_GLUDA|nr:metallophosphoesterase [Gluconacetobacter diazotrophicus]ACI49863.1 metallophosphoesterase [Gluconacetobacter diazotrophicus PA1 5]TWB10288.1 calcineurin-like phosphoesterase family protein [Gluconacetobacter diazotrophicus]CAP55776.1 putative phosphoesterases [Gluconacetobacter diazotrophicus PA1 5]
MPLERPHPSGPAWTPPIADARAPDGPYLPPDGHADDHAALDSVTDVPAFYDPVAVERLIDGRPIRVVGDVHGDLRAFEHAVATDRFVIQLGDLVDHGPDSAGTFRLMQRLLDDGRGLFILGNHDRKLARALAGRKMRQDAPLIQTMRQFQAPENEDVRTRAWQDIAHAPPWIVLGRRIFVHGGFHSRMLNEPPPPGLGTVTPLLSRALFGETTGRMQKDGYPERRLNWIDHIPPGYTVYCGHDRRSTDGRPWIRVGRAGGTSVFTDTGAGKGGHLAWIDLPDDA